MTITALDLAFEIDDPCGLEQIRLAGIVLQLITNRPNSIECRAIANDVRKLIAKYTHVGVSQRHSVPSQCDTQSQCVRLAGKRTTRHRPKGQR